jgi:two-component sensor histidine kinase
VPGTGTPEPGTQSHAAVGQYCRSISGNARATYPLRTNRTEVLDVPSRTLRLTRVVSAMRRRRKALGSMKDTGLPRVARSLPTWMILVVPLVTFLLASADALLFALTGKDATGAHWKLALATTIPLSAAACALTWWILIRLRKEIDRRDSSEERLRTALKERDLAIAELSQGLERERRLRRELDHRVRNNLSSLLGLVGLYEDSSIEPGELVRSLRGRISALREVYGLISTASEEGVGLIELMNKIAGLTTRTGERVRITGQPIRLSSREANALAMVVQELFTNASKHGSLRVPGGTVDVAWTLGKGPGAPALDLHWVESRVEAPAARAQRRGGLGLALIEGIVRSDLRGRVSFGQAGARWTVEITAVLDDPTFQSSAASKAEVCTA